VIGEITAPPSEAHATRKAIGVRLVAYGLGLVVSATITGTVAGAIGSAIRATLIVGAIGDRLWIESIAAIALIYALHELHVVQIPLPQIHWQVPVSWGRYGKLGQLFLYGLVLGVDVVTFMPYATFYVVVLLEATMGAQAGAALGLTYGLARALSMSKASISARHRDRTIPVAKRIMAISTLLHVVNGLALALVGEVLIGGVLTGVLVS